MSDHPLREDPYKDALLSVYGIREEIAKGPRGLYHHQGYLWKRAGGEEALGGIPCE